MDSAAQAAIESEGPERAKAVVELIESTLGIKIGPVEITEAAMSLSNDEKIKLAASLWEAAMPPMTEPTAGVYVLSAIEHAIILTALNSWRRRCVDDNEIIRIEQLLHRLERGDVA